MALIFYNRVFGFIASFYDVLLLTSALTARKFEGQMTNGLTTMCCSSRYTTATTIYKLTVFCDCNRFPVTPDADQMQKVISPCGDLNRNAP